MSFAASYPGTSNVGSESARAGPKVPDASTSIVVNPRAADFITCLLENPILAKSRYDAAMKHALLAATMVLLSHVPAWATWSVIAVDKKSGQVIIASATCVAQEAFARRQPLGARDLMDVQAVIVPGVGVAACQAAADNTRRNQMTVFEELKKGTEPAK